MNGEKNKENKRNPRVKSSTRISNLGGYDYKEIKIKNQNPFSQRNFKTLRYSIVEWLYIINSKLEDNAVTLFHSIYIFDSVLSKKVTFVDTKKIDLYAAVCYFISKKLNEVIIIDITFVNKILLKNKYQPKDISKTEIEICKLLNFNLMSSTIQDYTNFYISKIPIEQRINFIRINLFFNIFSQNFEEFIFDVFPSRVSLITLKASFEVLTKNITPIEQDVLRTLIDSFISQEPHQNKIKEYSMLLINAFESNVQFIENKEYSKLYKIELDTKNNV